MVKTIIKEVIIVLLICIALVLVLSIVFYNFNPTNKVVPNKISYTTPEEIKAVIGEQNVQDTIGEGFNVIFRIDNADLEKYKKSDRYVPSKAHPFGEESPSLGDELDETIEIPELMGDGGITSDRPKANGPTPNNDPSNVKQTSGGTEQAGNGTSSGTGSGDSNTSTTVAPTPTPVKKK